MSATPTVGSSWRRVGGFDPSLLPATRIELHHAVQLLASFGQSFVEARTDDSHRSMSWDGGTLTFRSEISADGLRASIHLPDFVLEVHRNEHRVDGLELGGRTLASARSWLEGAMVGARGGSPVDMAWPEYELPERAHGAEAPLQPDESALMELASWYFDAGLALAPSAGEPEASPVRCWPHHFDLATLLTFPAPPGTDDTRHVGVGFSPGDESRPVPYFYVNAWPPPTIDSLSPLAGPGSWNAEGWVGAVLDAGAITERLDGVEQEATVGHFLAAAAGALRAAVLPES